MAKWPKATLLSFSEELLCPMCWPSLFCSGGSLRGGPWLRSIGGLCPTICTANPLDKGSPTRTREDLSILELLSLLSLWSEGGEVPSKLNLNPPGWSDSPIFAANAALTWHRGTRRKPQGSKISLFPTAPLRPSPLLAPETHPQQLLAVLRYLSFFWSPIQTPLDGGPASFQLGTICPSSDLVGFLGYLCWASSHRETGCMFHPARDAFGRCPWTTRDLRICLVQS